MIYQRPYFNKVIIVSPDVSGRKEIVQWRSTAVL
jgi:hypothetical protein